MKSNMWKNEYEKYFSLITKDYKSTMNTKYLNDISNSLNINNIFFSFFILSYLFISCFFEIHIVSILVSIIINFFVFQYAVYKVNNYITLFMNSSG